MWNNIHSFDLNSNFKAWLLTIAKNVAKDYLKSEKKTAYCQEDVIESNYFPKKLRYEFDMDCRGFLTDLEYDVIILSLVYRLKRREIAEVLKKPLGTVCRVHKEGIDKIKVFYKANDKNT
ncbi:MAG: sigma-70 family RNA polymerase sigma factor [Bacilli bacterium]|nr:sigma-70 family RNA polymerase sigma factor [Bacilli bacterium]